MAFVTLNIYKPSFFEPWFVHRLFTKFGHAHKARWKAYTLAGVYWKTISESRVDAKFREISVFLVFEISLRNFRNFSKFLEISRNITKYYEILRNFVKNFREISEKFSRFSVDFWEIFGRRFFVDIWSKRNIVKKFSIFLEISRNFISKFRYIISTYSAYVQYLQYLPTVPRRTFVYSSTYYIPRKISLEYTKIHENKFLKPKRRFTCNSCQPSKYFVQRV